MKELSADEKIVYDLIVGCNDRITQLDIARSASWLGSHPIHESHFNINHQQSTLRKIRQIIRDLRI